MSYSVEDHMRGLPRFLEDQQARRVAERLANQKGQLKLATLMSHKIQPNSKFARPIANGSASDQSIEILDTLKKRGAEGSCFCFAASSAMHLKFAPIETAIHHWDGILASIVPGELAYFHGEDGCDRCIVYRPKGP